jgi:hypothetical protein
MVLCYSVFFIPSVFFFLFIDIYSRRLARDLLNNRVVPDRASSEPAKKLNAMAGSNQLACNSLVCRTGQEYLEGLLVAHRAQRKENSTKN